MKRKAALHYFDHQWNGMQKGLKRYLESGSAEDLHRFRVEVKKMRAFITLATSAGKTRRVDKPFKTVKKLFHKAGEIRTADLNLSVAREQSAQAKLIWKYVQQRDKAIENFEPAARKKLHRLKTIKRKLDSRIGRISDQKINRFYQDTLHQIGASLASPTFDDRLHGSRKQAKVLLYNYPLVKDHLRNRFNEEQLKHTETVIGNWHDNADAINAFRKEPSLVAKLTVKEQGLKQQVIDAGKDMTAKLLPKE